ncbi:MAG: ABC transporter ATP-binding protein [Bacteroidia bacterium]|nr:ABC transporter ATP-binding protein [Bacteroidia bacterium]
MSSQFSIDENQESTRQQALWPFLRRIFLISFQYKKWFWLVAAGAAGTAIADGIVPLIWLRYIDEVLTPEVIAFRETGTANWSAIYRFAFAFPVVFVFQVCAIGAFILAAGRLKEHVIFDLREQMFRKLQHLSYSFYDKTSIGNLAIRLTSDVNRVAQVISWGFVELLFGLMMITVSLTAMFFYNWRLSLIVMLSIPVLLYLAIKVRKLLLGYSRMARRAYSQMASYLTEHINGLEVNKTTVQETQASENFREVTGELFQAAYKSSVYASLYFPIVVVTGSLSAALVIYLGGHMAIAGATGVTIGVLAAFFSYARMIFEPILDITRFYATAQDSLSAGERIFSLIDQPVEIKDVDESESFGEIAGDIRFEGVNFSYLNDGNMILEDFDLHIPAGQSVAIVGATGSGKTTISSLICRFYEPVSGTIKIDGINYRERKLHSYRSQLGIILQTPHLFSGTFRDNLRYGKLDATDEEIKSALKMIGADEFAERLDEQVGEEGSNLSSGEKQMISFARTLLKNPRILIMDEATSSVDTLAEMRIQRGIDSMIRGRTAIIIAHRLSTIRNCDRILVINKGKIIEDGNHEELISRQGHYYGLYTRQAREN